MPMSDNSANQPVSHAFVRDLCKLKEIREAMQQGFRAKQLPVTHSNFLQAH
jgi:hypothetical protein